MGMLNMPCSLYTVGCTAASMLDVAEKAYPATCMLLSSTLLLFLALEKRKLPSGHQIVVSTGAYGNPA